MLLLGVASERAGTRARSSRTRLCTNSPFKAGSLCSAQPGWAGQAGELQLRNFEKFEFSRSYLVSGVSDHGHSVPL